MILLDIKFSSSIFFVKKFSLKKFLSVGVVDKIIFFNWIKRFASLSFLFTDKDKHDINK